MCFDNSEGNIHIFLSLYVQEEAGVRKFFKALRIVRSPYDFNFWLKLITEIEVLSLICPVETYAPKLKRKVTRKLF
jgi:hypothetical protein